jgi:hypothetical protein
MKKLPEGFVKCKLPYGPIYGHTLNKKDSFCNRDLNKPGTLIYMEDGKTYLIGHINPLCGVCDDCVLFDRDSVVLGYKVIQF